MTVRRVNMLTELKRLARGKETTIPARFVAAWAVSWAKAGLAQTDIERLERLYELVDPRD